MLDRIQEIKQHPVDGERGRGAAQRIVEITRQFIEPIGAPPRETIIRR